VQLFEPDSLPFLLGAAIVAISNGLVRRLQPGFPGLTS
jgi:hypothetical protein